MERQHESSTNQMVLFLNITAWGKVDGRKIKHVLVPSFNKLLHSPVNARTLGIYSITDSLIVSVFNIKRRKESTPN